MKPSCLDWCWQEKANGEEVFGPGACRLKSGSLSIDRMTLDTGRLSCVFDSGTASDATLKIRMHCTVQKQPSMYGAQLKLQPGRDRTVRLMQRRPTASLVQRKLELNRTQQ